MLFDMKLLIKFLYNYCVLFKLIVIKLVLKNGYFLMDENFYYVFYMDILYEIKGVIIFLCIVFVYRK